MDTPSEKPIKSLVKSYFQENNNYGKLSFKGMFKKSIESISNQFFNILAYYFDTYSEEYFHRRMNNQYILVVKSRDGIEPSRQVTLQGFDFIHDWRVHHRAKFAVFIKLARANKTWYTFNEEKIYEVLMKIMTEKGWVLSEKEKQSIKVTVRRLYNILYLSWDSPY
jgi:hypothetical protein